MIIDLHTHIGSTKCVSSNVSGLCRELKRNKVDRAVVFPCGKNPGKKSYGMKGYRLIPFFRFDPKKITREELSIALMHFKGIKLHPRMENFDPLSERYAWIFQEIQKKRLPVLIHTRKENNPNSDPDRLVALAKRYPKINFIFGHFGNALESVFEAAKKNKNLCLETSIVSSPVIIANAVKVCGAEKILFGSDYPYSDQELEMQKIVRAKISSKAKRFILGENAVKLLNLS